MARYDRIARIAPPDRDGAFPSWFTLRDLEGREREPELGRRARLRYLALRPVRRLLERGLDGPSRDSVDLQIDAVRQELSQLPARDPEREQLARYLRAVGGRAPGGLIGATIDVGQCAEAAGHRYAAEEFYLTALELARLETLPEQETLALRLLGRVYRDRQEWEPAREALEASAAVAESIDDRIAWARAMDGLAAVQLRQGEPDEARGTLDRIESRAQRDGDDVMAVARAARCGLELAAQHPEAALEAGFRSAGADGPAFTTIAASGPNATALHYTANDRVMRAGELLLLDGGARLGGYNGDLTRTVPVDGDCALVTVKAYDTSTAADALANVDVEAALSSTVEEKFPTSSNQPP